MSLCIVRAPLCDLPCQLLLGNILSLSLFSLAMFSLKRSGSPNQKTWAASLQLCPLTVWPWHKQSHLATRPKWRKRCAGKLSDALMKENTIHEGEEEKEKWGVKYKNQPQTVSCLGERKCSKGNWVIPLGTICLMCTPLLQPQRPLLAGEVNNTKKSR